MRWIASGGMCLYCRFVAHLARRDVGVSLVIMYIFMYGGGWICAGCIALSWNIYSEPLTDSRKALMYPRASRLYVLREDPMYTANPERNYVYLVYYGLLVVLLHQVPWQK